MAPRCGSRLTLNLRLYNSVTSVANTVRQNGPSIYFQRLISLDCGILIFKRHPIYFSNVGANLPNFEKCTCESVGFHLKLEIMEPMVEARSPSMLCSQRNWESQEAWRWSFSCLSGKAWLWWRLWQPHTEAPLLPCVKGAGVTPNQAECPFSGLEMLFPFTGKQQSKYIIPKKKRCFFFYAESLQLRILIGMSPNNAGYTMWPSTLLTPGTVLPWSFQKCPDSSNRKKGADPGLANIASAKGRFSCRVLTSLKGSSNERRMLSVYWLCT